MHQTTHDLRGGLCKLCLWNTYKVNFTTDGYTTLGSASEPKGHAGMSSAAFASSYTFNNISYGYSVPSY